MTLIWIADHKRATVPPVGYLSASSRRSDSDCLNRPHLANVMQARRDRENYAHQSGEVIPEAHHPRAAGDAAPDLPAASIVERASEWWSDATSSEAFWKGVTVGVLVAIGVAFLVVMR